VSPPASIPDRPAGFTVWLTGVKGAGKGLIAKALVAKLAQRGLATELLAGGDCSPATAWRW
jgi:adenylylsulfate kinase-like enzyme